jgi:hypothetical protein
MKERGLLETASVTGRKYFWVGDFSTGDVGNFQPALTSWSYSQQNGPWSNALLFMVPGGSETLVPPNVINMMVGDSFLEPPLMDLMGTVIGRLHPFLSFFVMRFWTC